MSSYVAVQGTPRKDNSFVFGLTPKEVRYLRVGGLLDTISDYVFRPISMCLALIGTDARYIQIRKMRVPNMYTRRQDSCQ